jgi:hypothetical protein
VITLDVRATGRSDFDEGKFPLITGIFLEESFDGQKAFENSLGVVDAIDADAHEGCFNSQTTQQSGALEVAETVVQVFRGAVIGEVNADGKRPDESAMALAEGGEMLPVDAGLDDAIDSLEEIVAVGLDMKADEIGAE